MAKGKPPTAQPRDLKDLSEEVVSLELGTRDGVRASRSRHSSVSARLKSVLTRTGGFGSSGKAQRESSGSIGSSMRERSRTASRSAWDIPSALPPAR